jgi:outer membrane lipoprotein SlyB
MKPQVKMVLAALAVLAVAGCVAMEDRPREVITRSGVQQDTYIPHGTAPYYGVDPYGNNRRFGTVSPE